ncbi:MAG TPA: hypothetical protein VHM20_06905 [Gammaproteobacteria bacterium]|jgi:hypothetical protein|nr:hypothetical protein [Gammaproteobacteria bacterium]
MMKNQKKTVKRLKNQLIVLRRKEKASRMKLRAALKKVNHLIRSNQKKLDKKTKEAKAKVAAAEAALYEKIIKSIKKKMKIKTKKT